MARRSRGPRPDPAVAHPPKVAMLLIAGFLLLMAMLAVVSAIVLGQPLMLINALVPLAVSGLFFAIALRQSIAVDRHGVTVRGFGRAGRTIRWADVVRLELTDASRWRLGPRLVTRSGRALPVPSAWRLEDRTRLPEAVLAWSRWARVDVVGERVTGRRWPMLALLAGGVLGVLLAGLVGGAA